MFIITEGVTGKEVLIKLNGIKSLSVLESKALNHEYIYLRQGNRISFRQRYPDETA